MTLTNPDNIKTLEEYILQCGASLVSMQTIGKIHERALRQGLLLPEEEHNINVSMHHMKQAINALKLGVCSALDRTPMNLEQMTQQLKSWVDNESP